MSDDPAADRVDAAFGENVIPLRGRDDDTTPAGVIWVQRGGWDEKDIPVRRWISRGYLMRGAVTVLSGPGSAGKSMLTIAWAAALTVGCAFGRFRTEGKSRVLIYNVEDDADEQHRRFSALLGHMRLNPASLEDRLALVGPKNVGTLIELSDGKVVRTDAFGDLDIILKEFQPDVLILDPLVEMHTAEENDNTALRSVLAEFRALAVRRKMAVIILHHSRKPLAGHAPGDPDTLRGASSIVGAARSVFTLNIMSEEEAKALNIPFEERRDYFRLDSAKSNYARISEAEWFRRGVRTLANDEEVAYAWPWTPPNPLKQATAQDIDAVIDAIHAGLDGGALYAKSKAGRSSDRWAGKVVMAKLSCSEHQAKDIIAKWCDSGLLFDASFKDSKGRDILGVRVNLNKRPGSEHNL
jgi:hypothetical protein